MGNESKRGAKVSLGGFACASGQVVLLYCDGKDYGYKIQSSGLDMLLCRSLKHTFGAVKSVVK